jgi:hypothetical protein
MFIFFCNHRITLIRQTKTKEKNLGQHVLGKQKQKKKTIGQHLSGKQKQKKKTSDNTYQANKNKRKKPRTTFFLLFLFA